MKSPRDWDRASVFIFVAVVIAMVFLVWVGACLPDSILLPER